MAREIARGDVLCEALLVSAYHRININFFFSVAIPSASHVLTRVFRYSEPQAYVRILLPCIPRYISCHITPVSSVVLHISCYSMSHGNFISWRSTSRGISSFVVLHVAWYFTHSNLVLLHVALPFTQSRRV